MKNLSSLRRKVGLSQASLSFRSGINRAKLSLAEAGQVRLSTKEEDRVLKVLKKALENQQRVMSDLATLLHRTSPNQVQSQ